MSVVTAQLPQPLPVPNWQHFDGIVVHFGIKEGTSDVSSNPIHGNCKNILFTAFNPPPMSVAPIVM